MKTSHTPFSILHTPFLLAKPFFLIPFSLFLSLALLSACGPSDTDKAQSLLAEARMAYQAGRMNDALTLIDSIKTAYPREVAVRRSSMSLSDSVLLAVNQDILDRTDQLITLASQKIDSVASIYFNYDKTEYDELGRFVPKGTDGGDNQRRSYIHADVNEYGQTQLMSTYCGGSELKHTSLTLSLPSGESVSTTEIPYNDGANYRYKVNESFYETVTYVNEKDGGALAFVALHADEPIKATLRGGKRDYPVTLSEKERKSLAAAFELSVMLRDRLRLTQERKTAQLMVEKLLRKTSCPPTQGE